MKAGSEPDRFELGAGAGRRIPLRSRRVDERQHDIFKRAHPGQEIELLEHKADVPVAQARQPLAGQSGNWLAIDHERAGGGCVECAKEIGQGRFARPGRSHDGDELAT
jgi:hypothetical protein